ncbi:unnamed protein product [Polarella glacialis]|uniref:Uncharacterized protein n=1 Tax=Polarella glacialis TaxID=89957 RepID=A0A813IE76_POLGL|nr:unnamed protein product [Polarella glacialis]
MLFLLLSLSLSLLFLLLLLLWLSYSGVARLIICNFVGSSFLGASSPSAAAGSGCDQGGAGRSLASASLYYEQTRQHTLETRTEHLSYIEAEYNFGVVADLDLGSRDPQEFIWRSYLKKGRVVRLNGRSQRDRFTLVWDEELELVSSTATRNRSIHAQIT